MNLMETNRAEAKRLRDERAKRVFAEQEKVKYALRSNTCPECKGGVRINSSMTGWVQCEQFGAPGFRKHPLAAPCNWQGFTQ